MVNSTRTSFTYLEQYPSLDNEKFRSSAQPDHVDLGELTSRGEEEIRRYGGDEPRDPVPNTIPELPKDDSNMVTWDGPTDPTNPQNWSIRYKWFLTVVCIIMTVNVYVLS